MKGGGLEREGRVVIKSSARTVGARKDAEMEWDT